MKSIAGGGWSDVTIGILSKWCVTLASNFDDDYVCEKDAEPRVGVEEFLEEEMKTF